MSQDEHKMTSQPCYPQLRMRRNRRYAWSRDLTRESTLQPSDLIWPVFVHEADAPRVEIASMPGVFRHSIPSLVEAVGLAVELGIPAVAIFPATPAEKKTPGAEEALNPENLICRAARAV